jgi:L-amino acid N-acyltransferase YncA
MTVRVRGAAIADAAAIAQVHVDTWRTTYKGIMTDESLASLSYDQRQQTWEAAIRSPVRSTVLVAEDDSGQVVGFASCGAARGENEFEGELYAIYVTQSAQGKGIGRELSNSVARDLKARGFNSMLVWVLADNPFRRFL